MKIFVGTDILELKRFEQAAYPERLAELVLTRNELLLMKSSRDQMQYLASRFCMKEAVIKALPEQSNMQDFEIIKSGGKPKVKALKKSLERYQVSVSVSHSESFVSSCCVVLLA
jgi:phosphopantetheine--protein transferase-like protein